MNDALTKGGIDPNSRPRPHYYELPGVDYVKIAEGYGVPEMTVEHQDQIEEAIDQMLNAKGPFVIDIVLTKTET